MHQRPLLAAQSGRPREQRFHVRECRVARNVRADVAECEPGLGIRRIEFERAFERRARLCNGPGFEQARALEDEHRGRVVAECDRPVERHRRFVEAPERALRAAERFEQTAEIRPCGEAAFGGVERFDVAPQTQQRIRARGGDRRIPRHARGEGIEPPERDFPAVKRTRDERGGDVRRARIGRKLERTLRCRFGFGVAPELIESGGGRDQFLDGHRRSFERAARARAWQRAAVRSNSSSSKLKSGTYFGSRAAAFAAFAPRVKRRAASAR